MRFYFAPSACAGLSFLMLCLPPPPTVWVVDDDGGPGDHFTDLPPAVAAAMPGDILAVAAGSYSGFTLTYGLKIVSTAPPTSAPVVQSEIRIQDVPPGPIVLMSGLTPSSLWIENCSSHILLDNLKPGNTVSPFPVRVESSNDVRFRDCNLRGGAGGQSNALDVIASRVEITGSYIAGEDGGGSWPNVDLPNPPDPSLDVTGSQAAGTTVTFFLRGPPGTSARLRLGRAPAVIDTPGPYEDRLLRPLRTISLGGVPPGGVVQYPFTIPSSLPRGTLIMAQSSVTDAAGMTQLTQSVPLVVR